MLEGTRKNPSSSCNDTYNRLMESCCFKNALVVRTKIEQSRPDKHAASSGASDRRKSPFDPFRILLVISYILHLLLSTFRQR